MNAFEKYVANEMIAQADRLIGWEYGEEAEAIFGADMEAGFYMNDAMSNEFFNKYTHEIIKCMNDYNIRGEKWKGDHRKGCKGTYLLHWRYYLYEREGHPY